MLKNNIIEPSNSMWQSPVVLVKKKSGDFRFAVDYQKLNKVTVPVSFPLLRLECVFDMLGEAKAKYFSTLDLASGFWQIPLDPETCHKASFTAYEGNYQWSIMPFGLINGPATYQMVMNQILGGLNWKILLVYMDDIVIFSNSFEDHLAHLELVFTRLREANLKLKPSKCKFAAQKVLYLGHYITPEGIHVNPAKTEAVRSFPTPKSEKDVRSFLGLCSFYRKFVKSFATIAVPLHKPLLKDASFDWTSNCENAFQLLETSLIEAPLLRYPDMNRDFIRTTDASTTALSYILSQKDENGKEHPIAYGGGSTRAAEKRYTITELECLALVGVRAYHPYLAHQHFNVFTDHIALKWLDSVKPTNPRLSRWALLLQQYQKTIHHRAGKKNKAADALSSRDYLTPSHPLESEDILNEYAVLTMTPVQNECDSSPVEIVITFANSSLHSNTDNVASINTISTVDLKTAQQSCDDFKHIYEYLLNNEVPSESQLAKRTVADADQYVIDDEGILYHIYTPRTKGLPRAARLIRQLAVLNELRDEALQAYHDSLIGG